MATALFVREDLQLSVSREGGSPELFALGTPLAAFALARGLLAVGLARQGHNVAPELQRVECGADGAGSFRVAPGEGGALLDLVAGDRRAALTLPAGDALELALGLLVAAQAWVGRQSRAVLTRPPRRRLN